MTKRKLEEPQLPPWHLCGGLRTPYEISPSRSASPSKKARARRARVAAKAEKPDG